MPDLAPRAIRVFVSSTFRDFTAERDRLARFTFPRLRRACEERAVIFTDVDLRWGITDEQAAESEVLRSLSLLDPPAAHGAAGHPTHRSIRPSPQRQSSVTLRLAPALGYRRRPLSSSST